MTLSTCLLPSTPPLRQIISQYKFTPKEEKEKYFLQTNTRAILSGTSRTRIRLRMTAYSPLRIDSSEFGSSDAMLELKSEIFPMERVLGIPIRE